jgi:hypothetical protein
MLLSQSPHTDAEIEFWRFHVKSGITHGRYRYNTTHGTHGKQQSS